MIDLYQEAEVIAAALAAAGRVVEGGRLADALAGGSSSTEILMRLRFVLGEILERPAALDEVLRARVSRLATLIDGALCKESTR